MIFERMFNHHEGRQIDKWRHYFPIYDRHFESIRESVTRVLEIGVDHGGSLQLWKKYFPIAEIVGLDINPQCAAYTEGRVTVIIGDQTDRVLLESLGAFDIVIDDGSHQLPHQTASRDVLWPRTRLVYLIEDCHSGMPGLPPQPGLRYDYPWVQVLERPRRLIRGTPSRELRPDEEEARRACGI